MSNFVAMDKVNYIPLVLGEFILNQKWKKQNLKLGKVDDRIPILQLARSSSNRHKETEIQIKKDCFKPGSRLG